MSGRGASEEEGEPHGCEDGHGDDGDAVLVEEQQGDLLRRRACHYPDREPARSRSHWEALAESLRGVRGDLLRSH